MPPPTRNTKKDLDNIQKAIDRKTAKDFRVVDGGARWISDPKNIENVLAEIDDKIVPAPGILTLIAGENLLAGEAVKISGTNTVIRGDATDFTTCDIIGFAKSDTLSGLNVEVYTLGNVVNAQFEVGLLSLNEDDLAYISLNTLGALTPIPPTPPLASSCIHMVTGVVLDASGYVGSAPANSKAKILIKIGEATQVLG